MSLRPYDAFTRACPQQGKISKKVFAERYSESTDGLGAITDLTDSDQTRQSKLTNYLFH